MGGHHIHFPTKKPCIAKDLNTFLISEYNRDSIHKTLHLISNYLDYYSHKGYEYLKNANSVLLKNSLTQSITYLNKAISEVVFVHTDIKERYNTKYLNDYDSVNCIPLIEFVLNEIIEFLNKAYNKQFIDLY